VQNDVILLLQNTTDHENAMGSSFEELGQILHQLEPRKRFGICLDTCNAFAAGYDLRTKDAINNTIAAFDKHIGMKQLLAVHLNDSYGELNSNIDRHEHIGLGKIGEEGFKGILTHEEIIKRPLILETPMDERRDDLGNLQKVQQLGASD
jgi:deoxyribonuclease-4